MRICARQLLLPVSFAAFSLVLTSCSGGARSAAKGIRVTALQGKVIGGQQPVSGSTVQLYAVGYTTDGGAATPLLTVPVTTSDGTGLMNVNANASNGFNTFNSGSFTITNDYTCPVGDSLVYLTGSGGNPGLTAGTNNNALQFLAALGSCNNLKNKVAFVTINDVTTVGAIGALYPYTTAYNAIGSTPAHASALAAAFNTANEYDNPQSGVAPGPALPANYYAATGDVNSLANTMAACINTASYTSGDGGLCDQLFTYATPPANATLNPNLKPADTVTALLDIRNNPTHNVASIFSLSSAVAPFAPADTSAPADWTLPITTALASAPAFSVPGGSYITVQNVAITDTDANAAIYYTTDGSTPGANSTPYTSAVTIGQTETLQAIAIDGSARSAVTSANYIISGIASGIAQAVSLSAPATPFGSTTPVTLTASSNANGSVVTFSTASGADGSFSPATCTVASGSCSVSYVPTGALAAATYSGGFTASFSATGSYVSAAAASNLTVTTYIASGIAQAVSLSAPATPFGSTTPVTLTASSNANGSVVTFSTASGVDGSFSPATCTVASGSCSVSYVPTGALAAATYSGGFTASFSATGSYVSAAAASNLTVTTYIASSIAQAVSLSAPATPFGSTTPVTLTASSNANGSVVTFSTASGVDGSFSPATCTVASGSCSVSYVPTGALAAATYSGGFTASFSATGSYVSAAAASNLTVTTPPAYTFSILDSFTGKSGVHPGTGPSGSLVQGRDGNFYGMSYSGGSSNYGTIFKVTPSGAFTLLHAFSQKISDGANPSGSLVQGSDGNFYGMTTFGGSSSEYGSIFKITPAGTFKTIHAFAGTDGQYPFDNLVQGSDGNFYGLTDEGGTAYAGTAFQITPSGTLTTLHSFAVSTSNGTYPYGTLVQGSDGNFYGTTEQGGITYGGTFFSLSSSGVFTLLQSLGGYPVGSLVQGSNGNFYGMTSSGGSSGDGTFFMVTSSGTVTVLHSFAGGTSDGAYPDGSLILGSDGNFYGMTSAGGSAGTGTVFQATSSGTVALLHTFVGGASDGASPEGSLVQGGDGNFYGMTFSGGSSGKGVIFKFAPTPTLAAPITLTVPASVNHGASFQLGYAASNAYSTTLQTCTAFNSGPQTDWTGPITAAPTVTNVTLTAPATAGTYTYTLTCGGMETGLATLTVN